VGQAVDQPGDRATWWMPLQRALQVSEADWRLRVAAQCGDERKLGEREPRR
jgi:hypothetical protein